MSLKFRQFQNNSSAFDNTPNNFRYTHRRSDFCVLCPIRIQEIIRQLCSNKYDLITFADTAQARMWQTDRRTEGS